MTLNCLGTLVDLSTPKVMGILNLTPNSFYDGGKYLKDDRFLQQVEKMVAEGADFIDLGAYSSKPSAEEVSEDEEVKRLVPALEKILHNFPNLRISVDTFRATVAKEAIQAGACIINDISAGSLDPKMLPTMAALQVPYIMMHMKGNPQTMQSLAQYENLLIEMNFYFSERVALARSLGINDLIIDPGFGFAKTTEQNFELLNQLELLQFHELPILVGVSRKSMIYKTIDTTAEFALNGTTVLNTIALQKGAAILRVHDVKEAVETIKLVAQL